MTAVDTEPLNLGAICYATLVHQNSTILSSPLSETHHLGETLSTDGKQA